jgi:hypothetical protein
MMLRAIAAAKKKNDRIDAAGYERQPSPVTYPEM